MLLAGFLDMGLSPGQVEQALSFLGLPKVRIRVRRVLREGLRASQVLVEAKQGSAPSLRSAGELIARIRRSRLSGSLKGDILQAMTRLARAEGEVHRVPWSRVIFHQLGRVDMLASAVGFFAGIEHFRVRAVHVSRVPLGGWHQDHDGRWRPVPGPVTQRLLRPFSIVRREGRFEWTTPTGALLMAAVAVPVPAPPFVLKGVGHAVGHRSAPLGQGPAVLKLLLGEPV